MLDPELQAASVVETPDVDPPEPEPESEAVEPEKSEADRIAEAEMLLYKAGRLPFQQQQAAPQPQAEFIEGTTIPKPPGYELMNYDQQTSYIVDYKMGLQSHAMSTVERNKQAVMAETPPEYREAMQDILAKMDSRALSSEVTPQGVRELVQYAAGKTIMERKPTKPIPGSSPTTPRPATIQPVDTETTRLMTELADTYPAFKTEEGQKLMKQWLVEAQ